MRKPVFVDDLPTIESISGHKPRRYRLLHNRALADLLLDPDTEWSDRTACPACGAGVETASSFTTKPLHFLRCRECNTIYAQKVPSESVLERARLEINQTVAETATAAAGPTTEFVSILNWITLTEARYERTSDRVLDYRFCSQASGWEQAVADMSQSSWVFLPLTIEEEAHATLARRLRSDAPGTVLVMSEMDRVADPQALLRLIKQAVMPGTLVFVASSCADGLEYELLGADSPSFVPLDRLTMFSTEGFAQMAQNLGFKMLEQSTPGRLDAVILGDYFRKTDHSALPFWSRFFRNANQDRLQGLQILLQRSLNSGVMRCVLQT